MPRHQRIFSGQKRPLCFQKLPRYFLRVLFKAKKRRAASTLVKAIEIAFKYSHGTLDFCQPNGGDLIDSSLYVAKSAEPDTAVHGWRDLFSVLLFCAISLVWRDYLFFEKRHRATRIVVLVLDFRKPRRSGANPCNSLRRGSF